MIDLAMSPEPLVFNPMSDTAIATVEIVIPVYNEEATLAQSVHTLHDYLSGRFPLTWVITIADNASTDRTWSVACSLAQSLGGVRAMRLEQKGRGRALRTVWERSDSPVVAYMDVDLSTHLDALLPLVAPLVSGHSDLAIGSRLAPSAQVVRGARREVISRLYNLLLKMTMRAGFSDAQCGFKAARTDAVKALLPLVEDQGWFFDTELLMLAEHNALRIHEVPVDWVDDTDSRVNVVSTATGDLRGMWRMFRRFARGEGSLPIPLRDRGAPPVAIAEQLVRFGSIGVVSTIAFAVLFAVLSGPLGHVWADVAALIACTVANTAANRRLTFALRGRAGRAGHHARALIFGLLPMLLNLATLAALSLSGNSSVPKLVGALTVVNGLAGIVRFFFMRRWVFDGSRR